MALGGDHAARGAIDALDQLDSLAGAQDARGRGQHARRMIATTIACRWVGWAQGRPGMAKNAGSAARIGVSGNGLWWKLQGQREVMRSQGISVSAHRRWTHAWGRGEADHPLGDTEMGSVRGSGIQTGGWRAILDEVSQDLEDLRGVGDHGDDLHELVASRAA